VDRGKKLAGRPSKDTQVGPEEPVYSPDGKYVYYSQNVLDSFTYEYSKVSLITVLFRTRPEITSELAYWIFPSIFVVLEF
jgi:hypothetical protein